MTSVARAKKHKKDFFSKEILKTSFLVNLGTACRLFLPREAFVTFVLLAMTFSFFERKKFYCTQVGFTLFHSLSLARFLSHSFSTALPSRNRAKKKNNNPFPDPHLWRERAPRRGPFFPLIVTCHFPSVRGPRLLSWLRYAQFSRKRAPHEKGSSSREDL